MSMLLKRRIAVLWACGLLVLGGGVGAYLKLSGDLRRALAGTGRAAQPLRFQPLASPAAAVERWGGGEVEALALGPASLLTAGGFGVSDDSGDLSGGLPTLRASALALWRGRPVAGLASGGLFLRREGRWEEARTGFGTLHVRTLLEGPGGELLVGAREGLFRAAWGADQMERLDAAPVRSLALGEGGLLLAAGEEGLRRMEGPRATLLATPDPWVEWVGLLDGEVLLATPLGLARGPLGGALVPVGGGEEVRSAAVLGRQAFAVGGRSLLRFEASGRPAEEWLPSAPRRVFAAGGQLFADTEAGLYHRASGSWTLVRPRPASLPPGPTHVTALASLDSRLVVGLFDGGLVVGEPKGGAYAWGTVPGTGAWGINALLPAGGALYVASLRGAARFDGRRLEPLGGAEGGAAFSLAATPEGVAIGYGQGVLLPGSRLLSAFHGLPGNQALALASGEGLFVGTPSGLGAISGSRVAWRVTAGEGKLPHPWITALSLCEDGLYVGTYGGGVARRTGPKEDRPATFHAFLETEGLKVNPGCLVEAGGRLFMGTDGRGLYRLSRDRRRFLPLDLPLPSPRVTALLSDRGALYVGTEEGLARIPLSSAREGS